MPTTSQKLTQGEPREGAKSRRKAATATALLDSGKTKAISRLKAKGPAAKLQSNTGVKGRNPEPLRGFINKRYNLSIAKRIAEAVRLAAEAGQPTRIVLDIDAAGMTTLTPEPVQVNVPIIEVEEVGELSPELQQALSAARERGRVRVAEIIAGDDMLNAEAFSELLGTTRVTVNTWRQENKVLGLDGAKRGFRFPEWQVGADGKPYSVLPQLHELLGGPWGVYRFMVQAHGALDGLTGREALQRGQTEKVLAAADGVGRDFS